MNAVEIISFWPHLKPNAKSKNYLWVNTWVSACWNYASTTCIRKHWENSWFEIATLHDESWLICLESPSNEWILIPDVWSGVVCSFNFLCTLLCPARYYVSQLESSCNNVNKMSNYYTISLCWHTIRLRPVVDANSPTACQNRVIALNLIVVKNTSCPRLM